MSLTHRIERVETSLTPKQAAILWLQEMSNFPNLQEYTFYLKDKPEEAAPLYRLPNQMEQAVRQAMKGRPEAEIWPTVRLAVRDVAFLVYIVLTANERAMNQRREWALLHVAFAEWLNGMILRKIYNKRHQSKEHIKNWGVAAEHRLVELYGFQSFINVISERYFDGSQILFQDVVDDLKDIIKHLEGLVDLFNFACTGGRGVIKKIKLKELHQIADRQLTQERFTIVDQAKAEALILIGERQAGVDLIASQIE